MPDPVIPPVADPVVPPVIPPGSPWFTGKVDAETIGFWQNKGLDVNDPHAVANGITRFYREAESKLGAPAAQLIRLPADPAKDHEAMKAVWQRLGAPLDAKDYDFPALKGADGKVTNTALEAALRTASGEAFLPKDAAAKIAAAVVKYNTDTAASTEAENVANLVKEKALLATNWGASQAANMVVAKAAAAALGFTPEDVSALESVKGYAHVMEMMRSIGAKIGEDKHIMGPGPGGEKIVSVDQAKARVADLKADKEWSNRYLNGDATAKREMGDLMTIIASAIPPGIR